MPETLPKMSQALAGWMLKLYKAGGLMLVFVFVGTITMAGGNFLGGKHSGAIVAIGAVITLVCLALFWLAQSRALRGSEQAWEFARSIEGFWWEWITPDNGSALSFVRIDLDPAGRSVRMAGEAFDRDGRLTARWESVACCLNPAENKAFYYWRGRFPSRPMEPYEGFGEIAFRPSGNRIARGDGVFSDANLAKVETVVRKSVTLRRCTDGKELRTMANPEADAKTISEVVTERLKQMNID